MSELEPRNRDEIYQRVTEAILEGVRRTGVLPWQQTWSSAAALPRNLLTGKAYRGINVWLLAWRAYASPHWLTLRQANTCGGTVRPGEHGRPIVYWHWPEASPTSPGPAGVQPESGEPVVEPGPEGNPTAVPEPRRVPVLRYYTVFNREQCAGLSGRFPSAPAPTSIRSAESIVAAMPNRPRIVHGTDEPHYSLFLDQVGMPSPGSFHRPEYYYDALFHELAHATGHPDRLGRLKPGDPEQTKFASDTYSREELVAQMAASMICAHAGILDRTLSDSTAYVAGWLQRLRNDPRLVVIAAAQASKAADWVLGEKAPPATAASAGAEDACGAGHGKRPAGAPSDSGGALIGS